MLPLGSTPPFEFLKQRSLLTAGTGLREQGLVNTSYIL